MKIYLAGRLRDPQVREVAEHLREQGFEVFDDWHASHPDADDKWREYEIERGRDYATAIQESEYRKCVRDFDLKHLRQSDVLVVVGPVGKSAANEMGRMDELGKPIVWLLEKDPERWDFMLDGYIVRSMMGLIEELDWIERKVQG